ncbi:MAG: S49 family peptidase [Gammaproteobacteria bacterium]|nr:S49 family peptidase [Gammaproteobacteria bacterium]
MTEPTQWEKDTLQTLLFETLKEQRRKRRWGIFFKLVFFGFIAFFIFLSKHTQQTTFNRNKPHVAVINIHGIIDDNGQASANKVITALHDAYEEKNLQAVILSINSPGGSSVQSSYMYDEVMRLRTLNKKIPVYAVCEDYCASGGYYIAASAASIYANPGSLVGSIGAMINGFGAVDALHKLGIERRLITSGSDKGFLDPFSPLKKTDEAIAQTMLDEVHQQFIQDVKAGRGDRLKITDDLFSGRAWTGTGAKPLGLIDGFGSVDKVARDIIKNDNLIRYNDENNLLAQLSGQFGTSFKQAIQSELITRW